LLHRKRHTNALNQMMERFLISTHLFLCLCIFDWITSKRKRTSTSSWRYPSSRALLYLLSCIGQILNKTSKKIGTCVLSQRATKKHLDHIDRWQVGTKPYNWKGPIWSFPYWMFSYKIIYFQHKCHYPLVPYLCWDPHR